MTQYQIAHLDGSWRVYRTETGIDRTYVGPRCATPREAARWADLAATTAAQGASEAPEAEATGGDGASAAVRASYAVPTARGADDHDSAALGSDSGDGVRRSLGQPVADPSPQAAAAG